MSKCLVSLFVCLVLCACGDSTVDITGPTRPPDTPGPAPEPEPDFDAGPMLVLEQVHGFSAFALPVNPPGVQRQVLRQAQRKGYNTPRICAEVTHWPGGLLPRGRAGQDALDDLKVTLDIVAREGMFALVVPICTIRDTGSNVTKREAWVRQVAELAKPYNNIFFEAINEYWHPKSRVGREEVRHLIKLLRRKSGGKLVGTDNNLAWASGRYRYDSGLGSDFPSFHPWRNQDPTRSEIREIVKQNGGLAVLSETTAWGSRADVATFGSHLVTSDKEQIQRYSDNCRNEDGCVFFFHSVEGLAAQNYSWMARRSP